MIPGKTSTLFPLQVVYLWASFIFSYRQPSSHSALIADSYDSLDRITNVAYAVSASESLAYDSAGNRTLRFSKTSLKISSISPRELLMGTSSAPILFTLNNLGDAPIVLGKSSNPLLVPKSAFAFEGSGEDRNVIITPAAGQVGNATVTIIVSDGSVSTAAAFSLSVLPNQPPSFQKGADQAVAENSGSFSIPAWATMINPGSEIESGQHLNFIVNNDTPSIFSVAPQIDLAGSLAFVPRPGKSEDTMFMW